MSDLDAFFDRVWERQPLVARGATAHTRARILTVDDFEALIIGTTARHPSALSVVDGFVARPIMAGDADSNVLTTVYEAYARRCTLLQSGLQRHWPPISRLCRQVENDLRSHGLALFEGVGANAYLTPPEAHGFDIHYDNHCGVILQLHGSKNWSVFPPLDELPIARCARPIRSEELPRPILQTQLAAGDVLYLPRGFPHCASTDHESSLHVTLSLRPLVWADIMGALCASDAAFRRSVIQTTSRPSDPEAHFRRELVPRFAGLDIDGLLARQRSEAPAKLVPLPGTGLRAIDAARTLGPDTVVRRRPDVICSVTVEGSEVVLRLPGATLRLPVAMHEAFEFVARQLEFTPDMLPGLESSADRLKLVHSLIKRGVVEPQGAAAGAAIGIGSGAITEET